MNDVTLLPCLRCDGEVVLFRADLRRVHSTAGGPEDPAYNWRCKNCNLSNCFPFTGKDGAANAASDANARRAPAVVESASPYDKAVAALAPYLPDGWVAQDLGGATCFYPIRPSEKSTDHPRSFEEEMWFTGEVGGEFFRLGNVPSCEDWRSSLRRILNGAVVPSNGQEP